MVQKMTWMFGISFILFGMIGFIPFLVSGGLVFGVFSAGLLHNSAYLTCGVLALLAARGGNKYPHLYFKICGILFMLATVIGFIQGDTILGLESITTADNVLRLLIAIVALWAGFGAEQQAAAKK